MSRRFSGSVLRRARLDQGFRQQDVAELVGRGFTTICRYEAGQVLPPADILGRLADALHVAVDDLYVTVEDRAAA